MIRTNDVGEDILHFEYIVQQPTYSTQPLGHPTSANVYAFHRPILFICCLCPFGASCLSRIVIAVRVFRGRAGPSGRSVLCTSLIKHSLVIGAPLSSHPSVFYVSYVPMMHSGLINHAGVYRSACSVSITSSVRRSTHGTAKH